MLTIIICSIIGIIFFVYNEYRNYKDIDYFSDYLSSGLVGIIVGGVIGFVIAAMLPMKTKEVTETYYLECLKDNNSLKGSFFLGCGKIDGEMKFTFYYKNKEYFVLKQTDIDHTLVKYSNEKPKVEFITKIFINPKEAFINCFAIDFDLMNTCYILYVPEGTIKNDIALDAN